MEEKSRPELMTEASAEARLAETEENLIWNMSLKDIFTRTSRVFLDIVNDLLDVRSLEDIADVFLKEDRLFFVGLFMAIVAVFASIIYIAVISETRVVKFEPEPQTFIIKSAIPVTSLESNR